MPASGRAARRSGTARPAIALSAERAWCWRLFNIFDADVSDIDYFYASRLPGEPDEGVEDVHTHPALPRSRVGLQVSF